MEHCRVTARFKLSTSTVYSRVVVPLYIHIHTNTLSRPIIAQSSRLVSNSQRRCRLWRARCPLLLLPLLDSAAAGRAAVTVSSPRATSLEYSVFARSRACSYIIALYLHNATLRVPEYISVYIYMCVGGERVRSLM